MCSKNPDSIQNVLCLQCQTLMLTVLFQLKKKKKNEAVDLKNDNEDYKDLD